MSRSTFRIEYAGPAFDDGSMDVKDLAPALLGLGEACTRANKVLNHDSCKAEVRVNARFEAGSFDFILTLVTSPTSQAVIDHISNANQILGFLGLGGLGVGGGALALIRHLRGKKPDKVEKAGGDNVSVTINNTTIVVDNASYEMARDQDIRKSLQRAVAPLQKEGVEAMRIVAEDRPDTRATIAKEEAASFAPSQEDWSIEEPEVYISTVLEPFEIVHLPFDDDLVWRLRDLDEGRRRFSARMVDEAFISEVRNGEHSFTCGDIMVAEIRVETSIGPSGPSVNRTITRVVKLIKRPRKSDFPELPLPPDQPS